jgi:hypothetical protein
MEATARNLLESYCSFYAGLWSDTVPLFINTKYPTKQAKDGAITGLICNIMNPTDFTGCGIFKTAYMRKRCLLLASVAFPDFQRVMYERYPEYCTEDYKAKAILEVQKLDAKDRIKKAKEELKKNLVEHKKATNLLKKTIKKFIPPACTFCPTQAIMSIKEGNKEEDWFCRKCYDEIHNPQ